ncbi:MAG: hypothetical protein KJ607_00500 [Bacteroidetes bacterium]|nr:hypothetical protein [Bacteroidota bacterium]
MNRNCNNATVGWLLKGDPSIRYQTLRDLTDAPDEEVLAARLQIAKKGWGRRLLDLQDHTGTWARRLYSPKWISTTYTLLELKGLAITPEASVIRACMILLDKGFYHDGGINLGFKSIDYSETCVTGMVLSLLCFFGIRDDRIHEIAAHLLKQQMKDGGWNCQSYKGAIHSSFHTTISVLEGLWDYKKLTGISGGETGPARVAGMEFLLKHRLFRSDKTGEVVNPAMLRFSFPPRWKYDIMRCLDYAQDAGCKRDERFSDAMDILKKKQKKDGRWPLQGKHTGRVHFDMEAPGKPSRWNTLRALRILKWWE